MTVGANSAYFMTQERQLRLACLEFTKSSYEKHTITDKWIHDARKLYKFVMLKNGEDPEDTFETTDLI